MAMTEQQDRVDKLLERIERHQEALRLKDGAFAARYQRHLGHSKTWTHRLRARDWKELGARLDKWEQKLTAFVTELDSGAGIEEVFESLPIFGHAETLFEILQGQRSDRRCGWLIAPTGCGKSVAMQTIAARAQKDGKTRAAYARAHRGWNESLMRISLGLSRALGAPEKLSGAKQLEALIEHLKGAPTTLLVDEVHDGGVLILKVVKTLIDETKSRFILGTYPTGYNRLVSGGSEAMAEAQQLLGRSVKPILTTWQRGLTARDVSAYLGAAVELGSDGPALAERIVPDLRRAGNLRALADAVELARMNADEAGDAVTAEYIEAAVGEIAPAAGRERP